jgi:hypothetical protein
MGSRFYAGKSCIWLIILGMLWLIMLLTHLLNVAGHTTTPYSLHANARFVRLKMNRCLEG